MVELNLPLHCQSTHFYHDILKKECLRIFKDEFTQKSLRVFQQWWKTWDLSLKSWN